MHVTDPEVSVLPQALTVEDKAGGQVEPLHGRPGEGSLYLRLCLLGALAPCAGLGQVRRAAGRVAAQQAHARGQVRRPHHRHARALALEQVLRRACAQVHGAGTALSTPVKRAAQAARGRGGVESTLASHLGVKDERVQHEHAVVLREAAVVHGGRVGQVHHPLRMGTGTGASAARMMQRGQVSALVSASTFAAVRPCFPPGTAQQTAATNARLRRQTARHRSSGSPAW